MNLPRLNPEDVIEKMAYIWLTQEIEKTSDGGGHIFYDEYDECHVLEWEWYNKKP